jgi:hypothetical protein
VTPRPPNQILDTRRSILDTGVGSIFRPGNAAPPSVIEKFASGSRRLTQITSQNGLDSICVICVICGKVWGGRVDRESRIEHLASSIQKNGRAEARPFLLL